ncbi:hypothetical protein D915_006930 [Fasciola hepatica]|uniref:Orc1-like AAA ATPase domain-containing protein n=1 Tax=Fasciola hepatica TaxID=6192 RepID=A0A4E0RWP5_FASHE|nr:hypothetical protein D915_006930 [Fasciola hepatica]
MLSISEFRVVIQANSGEFLVEREIIKEIVEPVIRKFCLQLFNCDFVLIDPCDSDSYSICAQNNDFYIKHAQQILGTPQEPLFLLLCGERLWEQNNINFVSERDFQDFLANIDDLESGVLRNKYVLDSFDAIYRLQEPFQSDMEAVRCYQVIQQAAENCVNRGVRTLADMTPYLQSGLEQLVTAIQNNQQLATRIICVHRQLHGLSELIRADSTVGDVINKSDQLDELSKRLKNPTLFFDVTQRDQALVCPHWERALKLASLRHTVAAHMPSNQSVQTTVSADVLNQLGEFMNKSTDYYARIDAQKSLLSAVKKAIGRLDKEKQNATHSMPPLMHYLTLFAQQTTRLLKQFIRSTCEDRNKLVESRIRWTVKDEGHTHYRLLMNRASTSMAGELCWTAPEFDSGLPKPEWKDQLMIEGRSRELNVIRSYLYGSARTPGLIFGPPGSGRSSILRWAVQRFTRQNPNINANETSDNKDRSFSPKRNPVVVVCCVSRTSRSSSLQALLVRVLEEILVDYESDGCALNIELGSLCEYAEAVYALQRVFTLANADKPLLLVFDDIDLAYPQEHVELFRWLPQKLPSDHVRILLTAGSENVVNGFNNRFGAGCCITLAPCFDSAHFSTNLLPRWVENRTPFKQCELTEKQQEMVNEAVSQNAVPLYLDLIVDILVDMQSNSDENDLPDRFPCDFSDLFTVRLKQLYSARLGRFAMLRALFRMTAYLACSRIGLTLSELIDLLQADREVQTECRRTGAPGIKVPHFPTGCLLEFLYHPKFGFAKYFFLVHTEGRCVITYRSSSMRRGAVGFWTMYAEPSAKDDLNGVATSGEKVSVETDLEAKQPQHQQAQKNVAAISKLRVFHNILADYWKGAAIGTQIVDDKSEAGANYSVLNTATNLNTRYFWECLCELPSTKQNQGKNLLGESVQRVWFCNCRRLTELPYQLLQSGSDRVKELYRNVLFSVDYMLGKLFYTMHPNDLIAEMYYLRQLNEVRACDELNYLLTLLRTLTPHLIQSPSLLGVELAGRIGHLVGADYPLLGRLLIASIDQSAPDFNCLIPLTTTCYTPVLHPERLTVRYTNPTAHSLIVLTPDQRFLLTLSPTSSETNAEVMLILWDVITLTKSTVLSLGSWPGCRFLTAHFPSQVNHLVLIQYVLQETDTYSYSMIDLDSGTVDGGITLPVHVRPEVISLTRTSALLGEREQMRQHAQPENVGSESCVTATVYSLNSYRPQSKYLMQIPTPCHVLPRERFCIGPYSWTYAGQANFEQKLTSAAEISRDKRVNWLQVRQFHSPAKVAAWLDCLHPPVVIQSNLPSELVYVGCSRYGYICRFDLSQVTSKGVRRLTPTLELSLDTGLRKLLSLEEGMAVTNVVPPQLAWEVDTIKRVLQFRHVIQVVRMYLTPDDRYMAVLYQLTDSQYVIGIWQLVQHLLIAGVQAYPNSQIRFGVDLTGTVLLHFVPSSPTQRWLEVVELSAKAQTSAKSSGTNINTNSTFSKLAGPGTVTGPRNQRFTTFDTPLADAYLVRGGNLLLISNEDLTLTSLKVLTATVRDSATPESELAEAFSKGAKYHDQVGIIYSSDSNHNVIFSHYNLITQRVIRVTGDKRSAPDEKCNLFFREPLLEDYPFQSYMSDDGRFLALVYALRDAVGVGGPTRMNTEFHTKSIYIKPKLPNINYYTSVVTKPVDTRSVNESCVSHRSIGQNIVRLYDMKHTGLGTGLRSQISLLGETIFQMNNKYGLFTLRPDHASDSRLQPLNSWSETETASRDTKTPTSDQRRSKSVLSRYSNETGEFLSYAYLDHPVIEGSGLVGNSDYLLVCCGVSGKWLRLLAAPSFNTVVHELDIGKLLKEHDDYARTAKVQRIYSCPQQPTVAVVQYMWSEHDQLRWIATFDLAAEAGTDPLLAQFSNPDGFLDVTPDGRYAIDSNLRLFQLQSGSQIGALNRAGLIPGSPEEPVVLCARLTSDGTQIVTVVWSPDSDILAILVFSNRITSCFPLVGEALLTTMDMNLAGLVKNSPFPVVRLEMGQQGRVIVVFLDHCDQFKVFTLRDLRSMAGTPVYTSAADRIRSIQLNIKPKSDTRDNYRIAKELDDLFERLNESMKLLANDDDDDLDLSNESQDFIKL